MGSALKPCPFCGGSDIQSHGDDKVVGYHCRACEATGPNQYITYPKPREWNARADAETLRNILLLLDSNASRDNIRRVIEAAIEGGE